MCVDTRAEHWLFDEGTPALRCSWPTADLVIRLYGEAQAREDYATASALFCLATLMRHPAGTEAMVQRLRSLRRAERRRGQEAGS